MTNTNPPPGSPEAVEAGCTCRKWEGDIYAEGINLPPQHVIWWEFTNCPLHGRPAGAQADPARRQDAQH